MEYGQPARLLDGLFQERLARAAALLLRLQQGLQPAARRPLDLANLAPRRPARARPAAGAPRAAARHATLPWPPRAPRRRPSPACAAPA
eukprot:4613592-Prymnesium_polylepis.1